MAEAIPRYKLLQLPALPSFRTDIFLAKVRTRVRHFQIRPVPLQSLSRSKRGIPKKQRLGNQALEFKIPAGLRLASFAGVQPFALIPRRPGQRFRRLLEAVHLRLRDQLRKSSIEPTENLAAVSDEQ